MGNTDNKKRKQGKIARFTAPEAVKHFAPGRKIPSDVLGSYTGTPLDSCKYYAAAGKWLLHIFISQRSIRSFRP